MENAKVCFEIEQDEDGYPPFDSENVWGIAQASGRYKIDNIPFYTNKATYGDIVDVEIRDGTIWFSEVNEWSGNSLVRIKFYDEEAIVPTCETLERLGCEFEINDRVKSLISVSVPKGTDFDGIRRFLEEGSLEGSWDYEEAIIWD